jgi:hypothetical protein
MKYLVTHAFYLDYFKIILSKCKGSPTCRMAYRVGALTPNIHSFKLAYAIIRWRAPVHTLPAASELQPDSQSPARSIRTRLSGLSLMESRAAFVLFTSNLAMLRLRSMWFFNRKLVAVESGLKHSLAV